MYDLVIVESPAKAKTIEGYLGSGYRVVSSVGHVLDLATSGPGGLGIDVENNFEPTYKVISGKKKVINEIKKLAKDAEKVYIATDPDREGEAIGWHLCLQLDLDVEDEIRISFPEITKEAIEKGIKEAHFLDMNLVHSQETRRMIDRIMGFKLSKLLQKKIKVKSAGRVQSVALQMIVERENEIRKFVPDEYWKLFAQVDGLQLDYKDNDKKVSKEIIEDLYNLSNKTNCLRVDEIKIKNKKQTSRLPYTTSTFQQDAINRLGFSSRRAMSMAQKLYEGIEVDGKLEGLITYMRTDSMRLSPGFITQTKGYIESEYGPEYIGNYKIGKKKGNVQDAHEAIRPSNVFNTPSKVKAFLTTEQFKIYQLIWNRTVASLMADAKLETSSYLFTNNEKVPFKAANTKVLFDGYQKVFYEEEKEANYEIKYVVDEVIKVKAYEKTQHFTQPKPRYTEAKLIKKLEENGVGRPSTYSSIIETLKKRMYVAMESKKFVPTEDGELVTTKLKEFFSTIVNVDYT
ncbi:MAG: type I DNA topoisomerase, partial [Spiroplasma sp.]|nr:type I DNA topoisomerase [Mycoplasmatales bacterium]